MVWIDKVSNSSLNGLDDMKSIFLIKDNISFIVKPRICGRTNGRPLFLNSCFFSKPGEIEVSNYVAQYIIVAQLKSL